MNNINSSKAPTPIRIYIIRSSSSFGKAVLPVVDGAEVGSATLLKLKNADVSC